jgi:LDH2 family malate/lactate/ureidoglycolate dehydrogenase
LRARDFALVRVRDFGFAVVLAGFAAAAGFVGVSFCFGAVSVAMFGSSDVNGQVLAG